MAAWGTTWGTRRPDFAYAKGKAKPALEIVAPRSVTTPPLQGRVQVRVYAGGSTSLARTEQSNGYTVTTTTALGRSRAYQVEQPTGAVRRTVTSPSGAKTVTLIGTDGSEQTSRGLPTN